MIDRKQGFTGMAGYSLIILLLSLLIVGGSARPGSAAEEEKNVKLLEGARQEGKIAVYTTQTITDSTIIAKKFEERYPFLKVEVYRAPTVTLLNKIIGETKAKKYTPDVIEMPGFQTYVLKKEGLYTRYISPEGRSYQEGLKDPEGHCTSVYVLPYLMGYNTKMLARKDIPDTYEGFLQPRWKGRKIGFDTKEVEWFANMLKIMGEEKGMDFFHKLVAQQLNYRAGHTLITDFIIAGEFPVGTVYPQAVEDRKKKGAKVEWVAVSPVIAKFGALGLAAHAPHPQAGKLFIDFCLSREGQAVISSLGRLPARPDVDAEILKAFKGIKLYPSDIALAEKFNVYSKQLAELLR